MPYSVTLVEGLRTSTRRGIAFLECTDDEEIDAKQIFIGLNPKTKRDVLSRFELWLDGGTCNKYFHGWDVPDRKECFVFKWREGKIRHRLYGFLTNPKPKTNARYQAYIAVSHAQKNTEETDPSELNSINALRKTREVIEAVGRTFPDREEGQKHETKATLDRRKR